MYPACCGAMLLATMESALWSPIRKSTFTAAEEVGVFQSRSYRFAIVTVDRPC